MLEFKVGNLLEEDVEALVNTVNCVGVMGRGIAMQFKNNYPDNFKAYQKACRQKDVRLGKMHVHETNQLTNPKYIINFPTKGHWKKKSRFEDIETGLIDLTRVLRNLNVQSVAIPPLGCGLGGLNWMCVRKFIQAAFQNNDNLRIVVFEPNDQKYTYAASAAPDMTPGRAALILLMDRYLNGLLDPFITLLEIHKLMYFMQEIKEPLRLQFTKGPYGPYANNLRHVLLKMEGHYIAGYNDGGDNPFKQIHLVPGALNEARSFLKDKTETEARLERVSQLVDGFESSLNLELLASVHWVAKYDNKKTPDEMTEGVRQWSDRKQKIFTPRMISIAIKQLAQKEWLTLM
jgi:O-acetyl-ADP-ribose deacetylase (regulator of RNase III)